MSALECTVAAAWPTWQGEARVRLVAGATAADALREARSVLEATGLRFSLEEERWWADAPIGIFGEICARDRRLEAGDRVELYRPLAVDPKSARRARARGAQTEKGRNPLTAKPQRRQ
jgi:putative ubiquitin-RnfH superfamily antitoxin RatB of RatAB toxin-antitoxin module